MIELTEVAPRVLAQTVFDSSVLICVELRG